MPEETITVCAARTDAVVCAIHELIAELEERIEDGEPFDSPKLIRTADRLFGGTRAEGKYTSRDACDALEIAVNNYLLEKHARELMQMDVTEALASVLRPLMKRLPRQTDLTLEQTELQQFSTPPTLAYLAARLLSPKPTDIVLEPSAGTGSLAIWPRAVGAKVICNETSLRRNSLLRCVLNFDALPLDAQFIDDLLPANIQPTAVLMNPPFSSTSGRVTKTNPVYEARHVASALRRLKDGGLLVAIVGEAMSFHHAYFSDWGQRIALLCKIRANLTLSGSEYAMCGPTPAMQILVIDKSGATPGQCWQEQLRNIHWGSAATLEDACDALRHLIEPSPAPDNDPEESNKTESGACSAGFVFFPFVSTRPKTLRNYNWP
jgi:predicted RNA methylase